MKKRFISMFVWMLFTAAVLTAGGQEEAKDEKTELTFWHTFQDAQQAAAVQEIVDLYMEKNTDISVEVTVWDGDQAKTVFGPALATNEAPDIMYTMSNDEMLGVFAEAGYVIPLEDAYEKYGWDDILPAHTKTSCYKNDRLYGIGHELDILGVYYNKVIFAECGLEVPEDYDEFLNVCEVLKENGYIPIAFANQNGWPAYHQQSFFYNNIVGKEQLHKDMFEAGSFDRPEYVESIEYFLEWIEKDYVIPDTLSVTYNDGNAMFNTGKAGMHTTGLWAFNSFYDALGDDIGFFQFPQIKDDKPAINPGGIGSCFTVTSNCENPDLAFDFLDFLISSDVAEIWLSGSIIPGVHLTDQQVDSYAMPPLFRDIVKAVNSPAGFGFNVDIYMTAEVNEVTLNVLQEAIAGKKTAEQVIAEIDAAWQISK